jgi:hypothetical protein
VLQVRCLSLTGLYLLVPLVQLDLEVVDVALGSNQLILSVLQSGTGAIEVVSLEVVATISPHQLITQLPDARLQCASPGGRSSVEALGCPSGCPL